MLVRFSGMSISPSRPFSHFSCYWYFSSTATARISDLARCSLGLEFANDRHEVAYIFGQLCSPHSVPSLLHVLRDQKEDDMVRHEAAEALGGIASDGAEEKGEDVLAILREWAVKEDAPVVVRESCQVAIDMWEVSVFLLYSSLLLYLLYLIPYPVVSDLLGGND
jgi:hypothetical protein